MSDLTLKLESLALFRGLLDKEPLKSFRRFAVAYDSNSPIEDVVSAYSAFVSVLYELNPEADFSAALWDALIDSDNPYIRHRIGSIIHPEDQCRNKMGDIMTATARHELKLITEIGSHCSMDFTGSIDYNGYLPAFSSGEIDFCERYMSVINNLSSEGYGMYAKYHVFRVDNGELLPVKNPDAIRTEDLFCYEAQREKVISNTRAFIEGKPAADILLYGDAGTGKSSTVKAVSRMFRDKGIRLVELPKKELGSLSDIIAKLSESPMKFIVFIDDLSFEANDDRIGTLKSVLEGTASGHRRNILVYCTSNRRHMIKETFSDRSDEIHATDTIAEQMSLSERFGLRILFDKPNKFVYLDIVRNLAKARGIEMPDETLCAQAETFAIRAGGRSARLARQFVDSLYV